MIVSPMSGIPRVRSVDAHTSPPALLSCFDVSAQGCEADRARLPHEEEPSSAIPFLVVCCVYCSCCSCCCAALRACYKFAFVRVSTNMLRRVYISVTGTKLIAFGFTRRLRRSYLCMNKDPGRGHRDRHSLCAFRDLGRHGWLYGITGTEYGPDNKKHLRINYQ